jgi:hypothetical protein
LSIVLGKNKTDCLHHGDKGNVANVVEVHAASIYKVKAYTMDFCEYLGLCFERTMGRKIPPCMVLSKHKPIYTQKLTNHTHFHFDNGGSMYP